MHANVGKFKFVDRFADTVSHIHSHPKYSEALLIHMQTFYIHRSLH
jgi:hypothetical protein